MLGKLEEVETAAVCRKLRQAVDDAWSRRDEESALELLFAADAVDDEDLRDDLYGMVDELCERVMPEALKRATWRWYEETFDLERRERVEFMDGWLEGLECRAALRPLAQELG